MNFKLISCLFLLFGAIKIMPAANPAMPIVNPMAGLIARAFNARIPSVLLETMVHMKQQAAPAPRSALVNLLLRANYLLPDLNTNVRINEIRRLALQDRNTAMAYQFIADTLNIADSFGQYSAKLDAKTFQEIMDIKDANGKTVLTHAIDHEDQACIHAMIYGNATEIKHWLEVPLMDLEITKEAVFHAIRTNKPRAIVAICPSARAITNLFENISDASLAAINTYYQALEILKKNKLHRASLYKKVVSDGNIAAQLPEQLQGSIQEMLHTINPYDPTKMMPALEEAVIAGSMPELTHALNKGCDLHVPNVNNMNALELAAHHGQSHALKFMVETRPYMCESQLKKLVETTLARLKEAHTMIDPAARATLINKLEDTMNYIEEIPAYTAKMNTELIMAANAGHTGRVLKALRHGANPNATLDNGNPVIYLACIGNNPSLLKLLLKNGAHARAILRFPDNLFKPALNIAIANNQEENFNLLLEHGADVEARNQIGRNPLFESLLQDLKYTRALLAKGANPHSKVRSTEGNELSMLEWTIDKNKPEHAKALLEHGADANGIAYTGRPLAWQALCEDNAQYLELLLKHSANPNAKVRSSEGDELSLLEWAFNKGRHDHAKILMKYGARYGWKESWQKNAPLIGASIIVTALVAGGAYSINVLVNKLALLISRAKITH